MNDGCIDSLAPRLAPDVALVSEHTEHVIEGRDQALDYFTARLDGLNGGDPDSYLAVAGLFDAGDDRSQPCAILYDRFQKSCVLWLNMNHRHFVERIVLSALESTLRRARPLEPPAFPQTPILPSLTPPG